MTIHEAKALLLTARPGLAEEDEPRLRKAKALAEHDAGLREWLAQQRAFHDQARQRLRSIPVPVALREQILQRAEDAKMVRSSPTIWWRQPAFWRAAAIVLLVLGLAAWWTGNEGTPPIETFRSRMVSAVLRQYTMDIVTNDMTQVRAFLAAKQAPADYVLPDKLGRLPVSGAGILSWQGGKVSMVCLESAGQGTLFLFVVDAPAVRQRDSVTREFADVNRLATVTWTRSGRTYVLAGSGGRAELENYF